ncbi:DUF742 domain-containing protein [Amycolatopsis anabasis]|uniref:DUF742 domain-containing protein n=1 Tax=Amycolatopsis anabasis TaxID=1840409 RepID=UPI00131ECCE8|nr:DUF742 domain-containing protein [Amycolatopsis anabasis]
MDAGRSRDEGWLADNSSGGQWPDQSDNAVAGEDWTTFRERVDREWRARRANGSAAADGVADTGPWLAPEPLEGTGPAEYSVEDFRDRLLGGPGSELFGGPPDTGRRPSLPPDHPSGEFAAFTGPGSSSGSGSIPPIPALPSQAAEEPVESSGLVRPYFRTKGRTRPTYDLAIEALVSTSERGRVLDRVRVPEHRSICGLCLDTRSVAEVAAYLRLPLGVVRVLIGDVAGLGLVLVHSGSSTVGDRPSIEFMERVLSGLRRI